MFFFISLVSLFILFVRYCIRSTNWNVEGLYQVSTGSYVSDWKRKFLILPRNRVVLGFGYERRIVKGVSADTAYVYYEVTKKL